MSDELVTISNVELISVGAWHAHGSGPGGGKEVVFTEEDLRNIIASQDAPDVKEPRMILGHTGPTEGPGMSAVADEGFFGEQPAIGKFTNLSLSTDGQKITADLVGVPKWLADILPTAYPNRSVEVYWNVPSGIPGAPEHACIMPRVALLGINLPAVATLEDLRVLFSEDGPEIELDLAKASKRVAASRGDTVPNRVAASVQFEDVRRDFYNEFATEQSGRYWWYITAVYVDPQVLIVDDDEESLWSVPYSIKGDSIEFGEPTEIKVQYVEQGSGKVVAQVVESTVGAKMQLGREYTKAASRPPERKKESHMAIDIAALRERTGLSAEQLPDDATEEQINAALSAPAPEPETPEGEPEGEPAAADASMTITVDRAAWEEQQRITRDLHADLTRRTQTELESRVTAAIKAGKIPPSRKEHYAKLMNADPDGTTELLDSLEPVIPVEQRELGADDSGTSGDAAAASLDYIKEGLTEAELARIARAKSGQHHETPRLVLEG